MARKGNCPPGTKWDSLISDCVGNPLAAAQQPKPATEPPRVVPVHLRSTVPTAPAKSVVVQPLSFENGLWVFVGLLTLGSILAVVIWTIIYRQQTRRRSSAEDPEPAVQPLAKTDTSVKIHPAPAERNGQAEMQQRAREAPSCPHLDAGALTGFKCEESFTHRRYPTNHGGMEGSGGLLTYSTMRQHTVPLPATELGGTALVTTKTM
ncbi:uncharacterized protein LOC115363066 [Myripristis murdjan]|uniref:uncharacterized protein LOC115363066 n=1 Tax=Myripristis murdjan TaxID=586833 RepID=UPI0011763210|nr:uncharacterized protein LOC115363066 [Myripristis murdjan]